MTRLLEMMIVKVRGLSDDQQDLVAAGVMNFLDETLAAEEMRDLEESRQAHEQGDHAPYENLRHELGFGDN